MTDREQRSRQISRPENYKDFDRTGSMASAPPSTANTSTNQGESDDNVTIEAPSRDSDIDGHDTKTKKSSKKKDNKDKGARSKNPSINQIPSGTVSTNVKNLEPHTQDSELSLIQEGNVSDDHEHGIFQITHSAKGAQVLRRPTQMHNRGVTPDCHQLRAQWSFPNNNTNIELRTDRSTQNDKGGMRTERLHPNPLFALPRPTWNVPSNQGDMFQHIVDNDLSLQGLSDEQLAALSEMEYQQLIQRELQKQEQVNKDRIVRAR